jgi:FixJ family two-component response regulator
MSGYTDNVIGRHGIIDNGINFIEKPFSVKTLTTKIHRALHQ